MTTGSIIAPAGRRFDQRLALAGFRSLLHNVAAASIGGAALGLFLAGVTASVSCHSGGVRAAAVTMKN